MRCICGCGHGYIREPAAVIHAIPSKSLFARLGVGVNTPYTPSYRDLLIVASFGNISARSAVIDVSRFREDAFDNTHRLPVGAPFGQEPLGGGGAVCESIGTPDCEVERVVLAGGVLDGKEMGEFRLGAGQDVKVGLAGIRVTSGGHDLGVAWKDSTTT